MDVPPYIFLVSRSEIIQLRSILNSERNYFLWLDEYSTLEDKEDFFTRLGGGSPDKVPDETTADDDASFENKDAAAVTLYKVD